MSGARRFKGEIQSVILRWGEESDLTLHDMSSLAVEVLQELLNENDEMIEFIPDPEFLDKLDDERKKTGDDI